MLGALLASAACALPWPHHSPVETPLRRLVDAELASQNLQKLQRDPAIVPFERRLGRPAVVGDRVLVELLAGAAADTRKWTPQRLARLQLVPEARGWDAWLAWLPLRQVPLLADELPGLRTARLPWAKRKLAGQHLSQGVGLTGTDRLHCKGIGGAGVTVAVIDDEWHGLSDAAVAGELSNLIGKSPFQSPDTDAIHGTACAEVVADMAPDAAIVAYSAVTLPELQVLLGKLVGSGVQVVSDSSGWTTGFSFADNTGKPCELMTKVAQAGIVWVAAAGNEGDHTMWIGSYKDADKDGWLDFNGDNYAQLFAQKGSYVTVEFDWDDYPNSAIDLDLYVCAAGQWPCKELTNSKSTQDGGQTPQEVLDYEFAKSGAVYLAVRPKAGKEPPSGPLGVRLAMAGAANLNPWVKAGTVIDPAQCADAVAVGAVEWDNYANGPAAPYSSRGPTWDGRIKPDIAAPTAVETSVLTPFDGTSAACPHVAGAVAVQMARSQATAAQAFEFLRKNAVALSPTPPDNTFGAGVLDLAVPTDFCTTTADAATEPDAGAADGHACAEAEVATVAESVLGDQTQATPPVATPRRQDDSSCSAQPNSGEWVRNVLAGFGAWAVVALRRRAARVDTGSRALDRTT